MSSGGALDRVAAGAPRRVREHRFGDRDRLAAALAESVAAVLAARVAAEPPARLMVSGGTTPIPLFRRLRRLELPWNEVCVTLADERWVPPDHPGSNEGLVRRELLRDRASAALWVPLWSPAASPEEAAVAADERLARLRPFDVVVLGMGSDGHTASLFPLAPELEAALASGGARNCLAIHPPAAAVPRLTATLSTLLDSRRIVLHLTGSDKWRVYRRACAPGPEAALPVRALLRRAAGLDVYWAP